MAKRSCLHSVDVRDEFLDLFLALLTRCVFEKDKAIASLYINALDRDRIVGAFSGVGRNVGLFEDFTDIVGVISQLKIPQKDGTKSR